MPFVCMVLQSIAFITDCIIVRKALLSNTHEKLFGTRDVHGNGDDGNPRVWAQTLRECRGDGNINDKS